jgi:hypothetical protein
MISKIALGAVSGAALAFAVSASAQAPAAPVEATSGLPYCSAKVKDRCIQKSDVRAAKAAAKAG